MRAQERHLATRGRGAGLAQGVIDRLDGRAGDGPAGHVPPRWVGLRLPLPVGLRRVDGAVLLQRDAARGDRLAYGAFGHAAVAGIGTAG